MHAKRKYQREEKRHSEVVDGQDLIGFGRDGTLGGIVGDPSRKMSVRIVCIAQVCIEMGHLPLKKLFALLVVHCFEHQDLQFQGCRVHC